MKPFEPHSLPLKNLNWERCVPFLGKAHSALGRYGGLLSSSNFYMSAFFEANRQEYYQRLRRISNDDDWQGWIEYFLGGINELTNQNTDKALSIFELYKEMKTIFVEITRSQYAINVLDFLFHKPTFSTSEFVSETKLKRRTAFRLLSKLKENGIVFSTTSGRKTKAEFYTFEKLLEISDRA